MDDSARVQRCHLKSSALADASAVRHSFNGSGQVCLGVTSQIYSVRTLTSRFVVFSLSQYKFFTLSTIALRRFLRGIPCRGTAGVAGPRPFPTIAERSRRAQRSRVSLALACSCRRGVDETDTKMTRGQ